MTIELSCGLPPGPDFSDLAIVAETLGYSRVWIFDSAPLWEDPFVHLALAAERTSRIGLGTAVLIPHERSEMAMASAIATIARLSDGRFRACFGTGATARRTMGQRPLTLRYLRDYVTAVRALLAGETAIVDGQPVRMLHAEGLAAPAPGRRRDLAERLRATRDRARGRDRRRNHRPTHGTRSAHCHADAWHRSPAR